MQFLSVLLIAGAISIDALGVGIAYGLKKIKISLSNILIIALSTTIVISLSILLGKILTYFLPSGIENILSGSILFIIGFLQIFKGWKEKKIRLLKNDYLEQDQPVKLLTIRIKVLGLILNIMADPTKADLDQSNNISIKESLLLGLALNLDAFGVGLGVGMMGYSFLLVPLAALMLILAMKLGLFIGKKYLSRFTEDNGYFFTGLILILIGLNRLF